MTSPLYPLILTQVLISALDFSREFDDIFYGKRARRHRIMTKIEIDNERCKGCGLCTLVCPHALIGIGDEMNGSGYIFAKWESNGKCTGCALCAEICPDIAIAVWK